MIPSYGHTRITEEISVKIQTRIGLAVAATLALGLSACGSSTLGGSPSGSAKPEQSPSVKVDASLKAKLPDKIKSAGTIVVGTDASYAPNEFLDPDGKTVVGFDVDLFNAVAAKFGVKTQWMPSSFDSIIVGVQGGKYDMGISSFTINDKRKQQVNMVSYFNAGTQWATQPGNPEKVDINNACGKTIAVQNHTVQQEEDLPARQKKCGNNPIKVLPYDGQDQATSAVVSGRADAMLADSPVVAYAIKQSKNKLEALGDIYDAAPYGYVMKKDQTEFADAMVKALKKTDADGSYQKVLDKWGLEKGAISDFAVNPSVG